MILHYFENPFNKKFHSPIFCKLSQIYKDILSLCILKHLKKLEWITHNAEKGLVTLIRYVNNRILKTVLTSKTSGMSIFTDLERYPNYVTVL